MPNPQASPILTELIDGPVPIVDRIYAFDKLREVCHRSVLTVHQAQARLRCEPAHHATPVATAECAVVLDGGTIVVAGAVGTSMHQAVDEMIARLRRRLRERAAQKLALRSRICTTTSRPARKRTLEEVEDQ